MIASEFVFEIDVNPENFTCGRIPNIVHSRNCWYGTPLLYNHRERKIRTFYPIVGIFQIPPDFAL